VEISPEHSLALSNIFAHGEKKLYFTAVVEATIDIHKRLGKEALYLMMNGRVDIIKALAEGKKHADDIHSSTKRS
jgi:hypothetical protein